MELRDVYSLEKEGISQTISEYTVENFILSYSRQLKELTLPNDREKINVIVDRLVDWYSDNIDDIKHSMFIPNKQEHIKSMSILIELQQKLKQYN